MNHLNHITRWVFLLILGVFPAAGALGDGSGVLVQKNGSKLTTGFGDDTPGNQELNIRVFGNRLGSDGLTQNPSFFSLTPAPTGSESLPMGLDLKWDFLPMTIDGVVSNLFYWDAMGDVAFTPAESVTLTLHDPNFNPALVDGAAEPVEGLRIGTTTGSALNLHAHRWWWLQGDQADPVDGVYLTALRIRADGYVPTEPVFFAFSTNSIENEALNDAALTWVANNVDLLAPSGDYNFDGMVDTADYDLWKQQFGSTTVPTVSEGYADGNLDGIVDAADYTIWRNNLGALGASSATSLKSTVATTVVPEASTRALSFTALLVAVTVVWRVERTNRGWCPKIVWVLSCILDNYAILQATPRRNLSCI